MLDTNGRGSSGKRTRHVTVRYFFIADRVKSGEVRIDYCPMGIMIADYFTKPVQGALFWKLRDMIMGNTDIVLPNDQSKNAAVPSIGIPDGLIQQESRSVLKDEIEKDRSPRSLTVLPVYGSQECKPTNTTRVMPSKPVVGKQTVSWADIASRNR